jgi:hypothetical protein
MKHFTPAANAEDGHVVSLFTFTVLFQYFKAFQSFTYAVVLIIVASEPGLKPGKIHKYLFTFAH